MKEKYKSTEYGPIPLEWEFVKLNKVFSRITKKNKEENKNILTISAQYGLINQEKFFNKTIASKNNSNYYVLEKGDFAYNKSYSNGYPMGAIKKLEYYDKGIVSPLYICFRLEDECSNKEFYKYYFEHNIFDKAIASIAQEGARNHGLLNVAVKDFFELSIFKPPIKEQEKIADILSTVDSQIDDTDKIIEKTKELKKGLMQRLLTKGIGHKEFKKTEVGEIPVEWEVKKLKDISTIVSGGTPKTNVNEYWENGDILWATPTDITKNGKYIDKTERLISKIGLENSSASLLPIGTVLMSSRATIGERCINRVPMSTNQGFKSFVCNKNLNNEFLYYYIGLLKEKMISLSSGSTFLEISKAMVGDLKIGFPNIEEQKKIANILSEVDNQIEEYENKKIKLEELKKGLMQQLLTGKIRTI